MLIKYKEVKLKVKTKHRCLECGKYYTAQTTLSQTINPFNRTKEGFAKDENEIMKELKEEAFEWRIRIHPHKNCIGKQGAK
jgi:hypothetical protein